MRRAWIFTFLGLAVVVIAFAATWITVPSHWTDADHISAPASLFIVHLGDKCTKSQRTAELATAVARDKSGPTRIDPLTGEAITPEEEACTVGVVDFDRDDLARLKTRVKVIYGSAAAVVILVGLALGAAGRLRKTAGSS